LAGAVVVPDRGGQRQHPLQHPDEDSCCGVAAVTSLLAWRTAGQALLRAVDAIAQARAGLQAALSAAAAGCTVLDDGAVLPPARPPVPIGLPEQELGRLAGRGCCDRHRASRRRRPPDRPDPGRPRSRRRC